MGGGDGVREIMIPGQKDGQSLAGRRRLPRERPSHVETPKVFTEQGWNRWFMQIRRRRIAQMLKNGRLKICESVRPAIGETVARNTRNKSADVSDGSSFSSRRRPVVEGLSYTTVYLHATRIAILDRVSKEMNERKEETKLLEFSISG